MKRFVIFFVGLIAVTIAWPLQAQVSAPFDTARMQRDLDIMNGVLDRLVSNVSDRYIRPGGDATKGIFLPDYGVLFILPMRSDLAISNLSSRTARTRIKVYQGRAETRGKADERSRAAYEYRAERLRKIKAPLLEFFSKYADAIGQLDDSKRIAVYANSSDNVFFSSGEGWVFSQSMASAGKELLSVAQKADIVALRSGKLKPEEFARRVAFGEIDTESTNSEIAAMAGIIDDALQMNSRETAIRSSNSRGVYLEDFGAVFFVDANFGHEFAIQILQDYEKRVAEDMARVNEGLQRRLMGLQKATEERHENWMTQYKKFKQRLGEVIADYSHTLRQLKPQDNIVVTVDLDNMLGDGPQYLVCRVKKQHVDAFNARRLTREQFMKQMAFTEYRY
jgi:hypothetical protein